VLGVIPRITKPETLEVIACSEALALVEDIGIDKMKVVSDWLNVSRNIDEMSRSPYMMILIQENIHAGTIQSHILVLAMGATLVA
jgi:hypothetical protein